MAPASGAASTSTASRSPITTCSNSGDGVVIGESVHLSGHTVEGGVVKTGRVRLGRGVTVGLGSMVGIGVEAGERCQIGALSVVPKDTKLDAAHLRRRAGARASRKRRRAPWKSAESPTVDR